MILLTMLLLMLMPNLMLTEQQRMAWLDLVDCVGFQMCAYSRCEVCLSGADQYCPISDNVCSEQVWTGYLGREIEFLEIFICLYVWGKTFWRKVVGIQQRI